ncbi:DMT family transporter [Lutispora thermophila]|uniref:Permease of the drug/metabolite transporter (DMT) superfamily n=1 Tax=Lutispora thermophila DSM 19022 TaxID=1122184 RepID=A0A1M6B3Y0_9FIRM|nr:DMT family transporter [Lutispora thermophila]SHI43406.1 Permease of the drug/metabolite transporter (DMT) superfamily [Lutispora thermophila DSM 19022]
MKKEEVKSSVLLLLTAAIWGFAFVAQRVGMQHVGAFTFNGLRFILGSISLLPLLYISSRKSKESDGDKKEVSNNTSVIFAGLIAGSVLFFGASLQQVGLIYTTAGKAGFITGLYIVFVPILGLFLKQKTNVATWLGVLVAAVGLYFLSVNEGFYIEFGDLLEIIGAVFWAVHILVVDHFTKKVEALKLSFVQYVTCSILSLITAFIFEDISLGVIPQVIVPLLYGGIMSVGVGYTLQVVAQKHAKPSHAAIAMSMESVFASIGGLLLLGEVMSLRGYLGCALMLAGMLLSQYDNFKKDKLEVSSSVSD